jgi:hypothetical protein
MKFQLSIHSLFQRYLIGRPLPTYEAAIKMSPQQKGKREKREKAKLRTRRRAGSR